MTPFKRTILQLAITATLFPSIGLMAATPADPVKQAPAKADATLSEVQVNGTIDNDRAIFIAPKKTTTNISAPVTKIRKEDIEKSNTVTAADALRYESGLFVRQRYIGDPNPQVSMRGSNYNGAGRVMVYMDGMPIWNPLMSTYNGAPRTNLIGPGEIKSVEVIGGPFSAEHSGNAMGGVINYTTLMPTKREIYTEATYMLQPTNASGIDTNLQGFKTFGSYADKFDKFTTYFSYNHLENEGQPMSPTVSTALSASALPATTGGLAGLNPQVVSGKGAAGAAGAPMIQTGSDGIARTNDQLFKWKGGYEITPELNTYLLLAYQNLQIDKVGTSLIKNAAGNTVWGSQLGGYSANGYGLQAVTGMGTNQLIRETFTVGWGLNGRVFGNWYNNTNVSYVDIIGDTSTSSSYNPNDPKYLTGLGTAGKYAGTINSQANTGWYQVATKFNNDEFLGRKDLSFAIGYEFQHAQLTQTSKNIADMSTKAISTIAPIGSLSGGTTDTNALFSQMSWRFLKDWDLTPGVRLENWTASDGLYKTAANMTGSLSPQDRSVNNWAPKFSIGYQPGNWKFRYSVAKAYRYPVADELFGNSNSASGSVSIANATLKPEDGTHHNLLAEYDFNNGYVRMNLFHENIQNAIYKQNIYLPGQNELSSLISSVGEVETNGLDLSTQFDRVFNSNFDIKVNSTLLNSEIVANPMNTAVVGKQFPLMPNFRANTLTTYHYGKDVDMSVGTRYNSAMFSTPENTDKDLTYFGAMNSAIFVDLKSTYHFNNRKGHVSAGVDNVNGFQQFQHHPMGQRTYFMQVGYKF